MNDKKNKTLMVVLGIFALVIVTTAISFAYFSYSRTSETKTTITTGDLQFSYFERKNSLDIVDQYPLSDTIGAKDEANAYSFQVGMASTSAEQKMYYDVILVTNNTGTNTFTNDQIKYNISRDGTYLKGSESTGLKLSTINGLTASTSTGEGIALKSQLINSGETHNYKLRIWISDDVSYTGTIDEATGTMTGRYNSNTYSLKVRINASQEPNTQAKAWTLTNDNDNSGDVSIGDLICVSTECFYVYDTTSTPGQVKALAQYNLYVGGTYDGSTWTAYGSEATGLQSSDMKGLVSGQNERYGTTVFSSSSQKGENYSDYTGSIVEGYVNTYKSKLNNEMQANIQNASLIEKKDLEGLGCSSTSRSCSNAPSMLTTTSYWASSHYDTDIIWGVYATGGFGNNNYGYVNGFGVRPVITINSSEFE